LAARAMDALIVVVVLVVGVVEKYYAD
jgi:hypothetical protein